MDLPILGISYKWNHTLCGLSHQDCALNLSTKYCDKPPPPPTPIHIFFLPPRGGPSSPGSKHISSHSPKLWGQADLGSNPGSVLDNLFYCCLQISLLIFKKLLILEQIFFFSLFHAAPTAYGGSQARGPIGAIITGLCHCHSNAGSELHL